MNLKWGKICFLALASVSSSIAFSVGQPIQSSALKAPSQFISTVPGLFKHGHAVLELGGYWSIQGKRQHININGLIGDEFTVTNHDSSNGLVGFGYFFDGQDKDRFKMTYGVNAFYLAKTAVNGHVIQENLFTNLAYKYKITHYPVYAIAKAEIKTKLPFTIDAGIGPNFMNTNSFVELPIDGTTNPDHIFSGRTTTTFSATAGIAMKLNQLFGELPLECGYRFFYLGQGRFKKLSNQVVNTLKTGSAYGNGVMCSITV